MKKHTKGLVFCATMPSLAFAHGPLINNDVILMIATPPFAALMALLFMAWRYTRSGDRLGALVASFCLWIGALLAIPALNGVPAIRYLIQNHFYSFYLSHFALLVGIVWIAHHIRYRRRIGALKP